MNATHDQIAQALTVLGYENPELWNGPDDWRDVSEESVVPIPLDLASLMLRCDSIEPRILVDIFNQRPVGFRAYVNYDYESTAYNGNSSDPTTALILALAAMGEKEKE